MNQKQLVSAAQAAMDSTNVEQARSLLEQMNVPKRKSADLKAAIDVLTDWLDNVATVPSVDEEQQSLSSQIRKYRNRYKRAHITKSGERSVSNGDPVAIALQGLDPEEVCELADELFSQPEGFHDTKYSGLNPGHRRMCAGNRIRAAVKRGDVIVDGTTLKAA